MKTLDKQYTLDSIPELAQSSMTSAADLTASIALDKVPLQISKTFDTQKSISPSYNHNNSTQLLINTFASSITQKKLQATELNNLIISPVMQHCKNANRPEIFKLDMKPKFQFYRDEISEKMAVREKPEHFSFNI